MSEDAVHNNDQFYVIHKVSGGRISHDRFYYQVCYFCALPPVGSTLMIGDGEFRCFTVESYQFQDMLDYCWLVTQQDNRAFKCDLAELDAYCDRLTSEGWTLYGKKFKPFPPRI